MLCPLLAMPSGQGLNMTLLAILKVNGANWLLVWEKNWSCGKMFLLLTRYHYWLDNISIYIYIYCAIPKVRVPCQLSLPFVQHARRHQDCLYVNHRCSSFQWDIIAHGGPIFEHILQNNHVGRAVPHPGVVSPHCICHPYGLFFEDVVQKSDPLLQYRLCALRIGIHLLEGPLPPVLASQGGELCSQAESADSDCCKVDETDSAIQDQRHWFERSFPWALEQWWSCWSYCSFLSTGFAGYPKTPLCGSRTRMCKAFYIHIYI